MITKTGTFIRLLLAGIYTSYGPIPGLFGFFVTQHSHERRWWILWDETLKYSVVFEDLDYGSFGLLPSPDKVISDAEQHQRACHQ